MALLVMPFATLKWAASPLLVCVWPGIACARWLGLRLDWRDARSWSAVVVGSLALSPVVVFVTSQLAPFEPSLSILSIGIVTAAALISAPFHTAAIAPIKFSRSALALIGGPLLALV